MQKPIVIMGAMDVEVNILIEKLENKKHEKISIYDFYEGEMSGYPVVVCVSQCGTINAAVATYIAINKYNPMAIINEGTAGGHGVNVHTKDIVIGEKCLNIVSGRTPFKKKGEGSNSLDWEFLTFMSGETDRMIYQDGSKELVKIAKQINYEDGTVHVGIIGSGDIWNREEDRILMLNEKYGTLCEEMESIAVYQVANNFRVPVINIRVISDNEILQEEYDRNTGVYSQKFAYELVKKILESDFCRLEN